MKKYLLILSIAFILLVQTNYNKDSSFTIAGEDDMIDVHSIVLIEEA